MGKHRPDFEKYKKVPLKVIVTRSDQVALTGRKWLYKRYFSHSGYIGNLKSRTAAEVRSRDSRRLIRSAVMGMLPKNRLRQKLIQNLVIFRGESA